LASGWLDSVKQEVRFTDNHLGRRTKSLSPPRLADLRLALWRFGLSTMLLAQQTWSMGDAIMRTLYRVAASRRHLLEWTAAAEAGARDRLTLGRTWLHMSGGAALAVGAGVTVSVAALHTGHHGAWVAVPFVLAWLASPALAYWSSLAPRPGVVLAVRDADARQLRHHARRTWRYFETFVTSADQMLPPDKPSGRSSTGRRPSDIADQPRTLSARDSQCARVRLDGDGRYHRPAGDHASHDAANAALPRALLQLVRHAGLASARSEVCILRR
jgi:hypothetical protein